MSAAEMRQAAEVLRARARWATAAPWEAYRRHNASAGRADLIGVCSEAAGDIDGDVFESTEATANDATYIATVHPGVGLALADWLEQCADRLDKGHHTGSRHSHRIARLINGGAE